MPPMVPPTIALVWVGEDDVVTGVVIVDELSTGFGEIDEDAVGLEVVVGFEVVVGLEVVIGLEVVAKLGPEEGELPPVVVEKDGVKMGESAEIGAVVDDVG